MPPNQRHETTSGATLELSQYDMSGISKLNNQTASTTETRIGISKPHDHDVLFGRGGNINIHPGNETFRKVVESKKRVYLTARFKAEKRIIADSVLTRIGELQPPGRFLARDSSTNLWHDVGYEKARDKTSQALRENAPSIRKEIEVENNAVRVELQQIEELEARRTTEQYISPHPGQQHSHPGYPYPIHHSSNESINPSEYRQEEVTSSSNYHENSHRYSNNERYEDWESERSFRQLPSDQVHAVERASEYKREKVESSNFRQNSNLSCGPGIWNDMTESIESFWDSNKRPSPNRCNDEARKHKMTHNGVFENEARTPAPSGCFATDMMLSSLREFTGTGEDSLKISASIDLEELTVRGESMASIGTSPIYATGREESMGSIGGASLIHVFDNDSVVERSNKRETSEMSMSIQSVGDSLQSMRF